jgi:hypothetical protein
MIYASRRSRTGQSHGPRAYTFDIIYSSLPHLYIICFISRICLSHPSIVYQSMMNQHRQRRPQSDARMFAVMAANGATVGVWRPDMNPGEDTTWVKCDYDTYSPSGRNPAILAPTNDGRIGILVTCKNSCVAAYSLGGCLRRNCRFYHPEQGRMGQLVSNLPGRDGVVVIGDLAHTIAAKPQYGPLLEWELGRAYELKVLDDQYLAAFQAKEDKKREEMAAATAKQAMLERMYAASEPVYAPPAKRLCVRLQPEVMFVDEPLPEVMCIEEKGLPQLELHPPAAPLEAKAAEPLQVPGIAMGYSHSTLIHVDAEAAASPIVKAEPAAPPVEEEQVDIALETMICTTHPGTSLHDCGCLVANILDGLFDSEGYAAETDNHAEDAVDATTDAISKSGM